MRPRRITSRIALAAFAVAGIAMAVVVAFVVSFGRSTFDNLMAQHGASAATSRQMFDDSVLRAVLLALLVAVVASGLAALIVAWRVVRPLRRIDDAASRIAAGDYAARVPGDGPQEVSRLADSFNRMAESLEEQERMRRELIANTAHELRTPLTNLQGYLEGLRDEVVPPTREMFASLHEEADRLVRLAESLDQLAEGDLGGPVPLSEIDLSSAVRRAVDLAQPQFHRAGVLLSAQIPDGVTVVANHDHIAQVMHNLLQNAVRYTDSGHSASVVVERAAGFSVVHVINDGGGIPAADLPHVFERFYRVEKSRDRARGGAGIGLAIVRQLVERAGGRVGAESQAGTTRVWFSLPAT
jgi:two-component system, OmpR family, sensor histidine kinase BaeS